MGYLRYILAITVAIYHAETTVFNYHIGASAVISFYLISGYVMTLLIEKYYGGNFLGFLLDRSLRLLPQFLLYSFISLMLLILTPLGNQELFGMSFHSCTNQYLILNFSIFVNNFYKYFGNCMLLPQSWSLGLEAYFYIIFPFIIIRSTNKFRMGLVWLSGLIYLAGYYGYINFDLWGYRYLPGTLFIFLIGSSLAAPIKYSKNISIPIFLMALLLFANLNININIYNTRLVKEVTLGILLGMPLLLIAIKIPQSSYDDFFGNLSYGIFLNHSIFIWLMKLINVSTSFYSNFIMIILASFTSFFTYTIIEKPTIVLRRKFRTTALPSA